MGIPRHRMTFLVVMPALLQLAPEGICTLLFPLVKTRPGFLPSRIPLRLEEPVPFSDVGSTDAFPPLNPPAASSAFADGARARSAEAAQ